MMMKKTKSGMILLVLIAFFVVVNITPCIYLTAAYGFHLITGDYSFSEWSDYMDELYSNKLLFHDKMVDVNSLVLNYSGIKYVKKEDSTIVKMENNYLTGYTNTISDRSISDSVKTIKKLYKYAEKSGADFLYVACPTKSYGEDFPAGINNYSTSNCDRFYNKLLSAKIPSLILANKMKKENINSDDAFFITDHHWKPETGFWATEKILEKLQRQYGVDYDTSKIDLDNYNIKIYKNWFLGSAGKKVGQYFSDLGVDDISLIEPKFKTFFTEEIPYKNEVRTGNFSESIMFMDYITRRDLYKLNSYAAYSGGDFHLQTIVNHYCNNNKTLLIDRDSFACVVVPFLAMQYEKIYVTDMRDFCAGEKPNLFHMIDDIKPDCVMMVFAEVPTVKSGGRLDFN